MKEGWVRMLAGELILKFLNIIRTPKYFWKHYKMVLLVFPYFLSGRTAYEAEKNICYELEGVIKHDVLS